MSDFQVQNLLITLRGHGQSYLGLNLKGAYLAGADLAEADFTEADLSQATLAGATLERAILTKTQALGTDFRQTILTGATLEAWNIDSTTQLDGAICDFVYLLRHHQERRPSSGTFAPGEFSKLFQEVLDTIDLIFQNGIDWKAFVQTLDQVQVQHEGANLAIQAIENKGDGVVVVKLHAGPNVDKETIHHSFMQRYQKALKAVEQAYKAELHAKDREIQIYRQHSADLSEIAKLQAKQTINVEAKAIAGSNDVNDNSNNLNITGNISGSTISFGDINGQVSNQINQLPPAAPGQPDIQELLSQIQALIQSEGQLSDASRAFALEQLKELASAAQNPQDSAMKKVAKQSMAILNNISIVSGSVQMGVFLKQAWPLIFGFFGL